MYVFVNAFYINSSSVMQLLYLDFVSAFSRQQVSGGFFVAKKLVENLVGIDFRFWDPTCCLLIWFLVLRV